MESNHLKIGENKILREGDELHPDEIHSCPMCDSDTEVDPFEPSWFTITCDKCEWSVEVQLEQPELCRYRDEHRYGHIRYKSNG